MRKTGDCFSVVTPCRRTSSGSRASAWATRFCTRTAASSASVPGRKVIVICSTPSDPAIDLRYVMSSTPLIASSSGVATVSAITLGLAPGYTVRTTTDGGTTSGYSLIGSSGIAIRPAAKITIESTAAKIGRSMKNFEKSICVSLPRAQPPRVPVLERRHLLSRARWLTHGDHLRRHRHSGDEHLLHTVHDHLVSRLEPRTDDTQPIDHATELDVPAHGRIARPEHVDVLAVLVGEHRLVVDQKRVEHAAALELDARKESRCEYAIGIRHDRAGTDGARAWIDLIVGEVERARVRIAGLVRQPDTHRVARLAALAAASELVVAQVGLLVRLRSE